MSKFLKVSLVITGLTFFILLTTITVIIQSFPDSQFKTSEIFFRSWESKTNFGEAVYNTIKFIKKPSQEIWLMNQSHHGFTASGPQLDRLAIVIKNKTAHFYQLPPGDLSWSEELPSKKINLKVDCRQCHSNGPRAIRPAPDFTSLLTMNEKMTLFLLNLRMKFYGRLENNLWMEDKTLEQTKHEVVQLKTCLKCHDGGEKPWSRALLTLQQKDTIQFLTENGQMPPKGFQLSEEERNKLYKLINHEKTSRNLHK